MAILGQYSVDDPIAVPVAQRVGLEQAAHLDEEGLKRFGDSAQAKALRERLKNFEGLPAVQLR